MDWNDLLAMGLYVDAVIVGNLVLFAVATAVRVLRPGRNDLPRNR